MKKNYSKIIFSFCIIIFCFFYKTGICGDIRQPVAHKFFYPEDIDILKETMQSFFKTSDSIINKKANIFILPHSWYKYTGNITVKALNSVKKDFDTVIIIAESHNKKYDGIALSSDLYSTSLGNVSLGRYKSQKIIQGVQAAVYDPEVHNHEYVIEVLLPFLQFLEKDFKIIPIVLGHHVQKKKLERLSVMLASVWDSRTVIVGSVNIFKTETAVKIKNYVKNSENKFKLYDFIINNKNICGKNSLFATILTAQLLGYYKFNFDFQKIPFSEFGYTGALFTTIH